FIWQGPASPQGRPEAYNRIDCGVKPGRKRARGGAREPLSDCSRRSRGRRWKLRRAHSGDRQPAGPPAEYPMTAQIAAAIHTAAKAAIERVHILAVSADPQVFAFATLAALVLAALAVSFFAVARSKSSTHLAENRAKAARQESSAALDTLRERVETLASQ